MLYIYLPVLCFYGNLYVTEGTYAGGRGFPLSQRSFLCSCVLQLFRGRKCFTLTLYSTMISNLNMYFFIIAEIFLYRSILNRSFPVAVKELM